VSNPKPQGSGGNGSSIPACSRCGKKHDGKCLASMDACFNCRKSGHKIRDYLLLVIKGKKGR